MHYVGIFFSVQMETGIIVLLSIIIGIFAYILVCKYMDRLAIKRASKRHRKRLEQAQTEERYRFNYNLRIQRSEEFYKSPNQRQAQLKSEPSES